MQNRRNVTSEHNMKSVETIDPKTHIYHKTIYLLLQDMERTIYDKMRQHYYTFLYTKTSFHIEHKTFVRKVFHFEQPNQFDMHLV